MKIEDFSSGFDTLLQSYMQSIPFGEDTTKVNLAFDEYEKSYFLTMSQDELVVSLYTGRNSSGNSFDETEELRRYLSPLHVDATLDPIETTSGIPLGQGSKSKFFSLPDGTDLPAVWFITYEAVKISDKEPDECHKGKMMDVVPCTHDKYNKVKKNPFRGPNGRRALRLDLSKEDGNIEIICKYDVESYYLRYLRQPKPIILVELGEDVTIHGEHEAMNCELPSSLHSKILEGAVRLAIESKAARIQNK